MIMTRVICPAIFSRADAGCQPISTDSKRLVLPVCKPIDWILQIFLLHTLRREAYRRVVCAWKP